MCYINKAVTSKTNFIYRPLLRSCHFLVFAPNHSVVVLDFSRFNGITSNQLSTFCACLYVFLAFTFLANPIIELIANPTEDLFFSVFSFFFVFDFLLNFRLSLEFRCVWMLFIPFSCYFFCSDVFSWLDRMAVVEINQRETIVKKLYKWCFEFNIRRFWNLITFLTGIATRKYSKLFYFDGKIFRKILSFPLGWMGWTNKRFCAKLIHANEMLSSIA